MYSLFRNLPEKIRNSASYSWDGLKAMGTEYSFRLELLGLAILLVAMAVSPWPAWKTLLMTASYLLIPFAELVNTAIEDVCDLASPGLSPLAKAAKDKGSAAVLAAIVINALVLAALLACPSE